MDKGAPLNLLVFGAGAIGGYLGGSLARRGHRVTFLEREHNASVLRAKGLRLTADGETERIVAFGVHTSLAAALADSAFDVALFALKSYDTAGVVEEMRPHAEAMPPVLCLQNGVDNEAALAEVLGAEKLISGTVTTAIDKPAAGQLVLERKRGVGLAGGHELSKRLYAAFEDANLNPRLYADAEAMKWSKLLANLIANATSAILDMSPAEIFAHPGLFEIEMRALREALAVMDVLGLQVVDLPGLPTRALAFTARRLPLGLSRPLLARFVGRGRGGKMPSLHIDLHTGRGRSEVGWLNGAVARHGERLGVATPVNRALTETLEELINNQTAKSLRTETLLAKLGLPS